MTVGDVVAGIYRAQRSGALYNVVMECLKEVDVPALSYIELSRPGLEWSPQISEINFLCTVIATM